MLEDVGKKASPYSDEEEACERHFQEHIRREPSGRYIVSLPLKSSPSTLGDSRTMAYRNFLNLEKRLAKHPELKMSYTKFIHEYQELGHMVAVKPAEIASQHYFLPHHCVLKPESSSTKLRVVFNASAATSNGKSLNDLLMVGPTVQNDLASILIRFRFHRYVFGCDISKMYRQINVSENDTHLQYIFWRDEPSQPLQIFRLTTITYGTASAPYQATRCLKQLSEDEELRFPLASNIISKDVYVDDVLSGSDSLITAQTMKNQLVEMLGTARMNLRKWCSNNSALLENISEADREQFLQIDDGDYVKTLGLYWTPNADQFRLKVSLPESRTKITKRIVMSDLARVFDPLGLCGPVILLGKLFLQQVWKLKSDWDEALTQHLHTKWSNFQTEMLHLNELRIERHLIQIANANNYQLHGFSDASERAYGACVFLRSSNSNGDVSVRLICSKSRVAPTSNITLPRLELCAAQLLAELMEFLIGTITIDISECIYWTDSLIVLAWIKAQSSTLKTFVANRVAFIQRLSNYVQWRHVSSTHNPADIISRGLMPHELTKSDLWLFGPSFLLSVDTPWLTDMQIDVPDDTPERKIEKSVLAAASCERNNVLDNIKFENSFHKFRNTIAMVLRYISNLKLTMNKRSRTIGHLTTEEIECGERAIIRVIQRNEFSEEVRCLEIGKPLSHRSRLKSLFPFLDKHGIMRIGGRLTHSSLPFSTKFPILIPTYHPFSISLATHIHTKYLHIGPTSLLAAIRQKYWPQHGRHLVRKVVRACVLCSRANPRCAEQFMGDLPKSRVEVSWPFYNVGIDLCGPFNIHYRLRGRPPTKVYMVVFVCFAVKAVHLELVTELTSAAFIGAFKRFISARGLCKNVYTDNATNFVGTTTELKELQRLFYSQNHEQAIIEMCQADHINWSFAPPGSPHFGGLYEAAVKSAKFHIKRIMSNASLTAEEMLTVVKQVEAILNSRPLTPQSSDPSDFQPLTPGHFLIGRPFNSIVEPSIENEVISPLKRWRYVQQLHQQFWSRWSKEYLTELQQRRKWTEPNRNLTVGELVLLKDENLPPLKWRLGRVADLHPGPDGLVRVVTVKTAQGQFTRAIAKVCPLPIDNDLFSRSCQGRSDEHVPSS